MLEKCLEGMTFALFNPFSRPYSSIYYDKTHFNFFAHLYFYFVTYVDVINTSLKVIYT